jgi:N-acetylglutamate synthase-like GNAT family acetyltransferase
LNDLLISEDKSLIDIKKLHIYLAEESTWAKGISLKTVSRSIENSLCIGAYLNNKQVGFCRVITDYATFGNLADVLVWPEYQGLGIARQLLNKVVGHKDLLNIRRFTLATSNAHGLYEKFGFKKLESPELFMEICRQDVYSQNR